MKRGIAIAIGIGIAVIIIAVAISTKGDISMNLPENDQNGAKETSLENPSLPTGKNLRVDLSENVGVGDRP